PPGLKVSLSAPSNFTRQKPAAEEQFLESTPWANPQHPIHHQSITNIQRRASGYLGPFQTPVVQRQATDHNAHNGSASTIAEIQSGQGSSLGPTPTTLDRGFAPPQHAQTDKPDTSPIITPSKMTKSATEGQPLERATSGAPLDVVASHQSTTTEPPRLGLGQTPTSSTSQPEQAISPPVKTGTFASQKAVSPPNVPPSPFHKPDYSALGLMDHSRQRIHPLPSQQLGASSNNDLGPL
ncbi:hypothetical protein MMC20_001541, partial [Loxospora ochrophaea]|nr:hypothetical protein [Loxospora ochrophaea]